HDTLHMWTQVVGKIRLMQAPLVNHWWEVPLYLTSRGLTTSPIPHGSRTFDIDFDFFEHRLDVRTSDGASESLALSSRSVAAFYEEIRGILERLDVPVEIRPRPVEIEEAIPFDEDEEHQTYDPDAAHRFWKALLQVDRVLKRYRENFIGKTSPVHFFWGSFDHAVTRFSGRPAPPHPGGIPNFPDWAVREAYSHEVHSVGFWPGKGLGEAAFYAYAYPEPDGFSEVAVAPDGAYYHADLREFVLPYEAVRTSRDPDSAVLDFAQSTYDAAATLGGWNRKELEREPGGKTALARKLAL
ncbi:MAG: DUF5996 family protein, partial [Longimicrobiales bacterium]|nr:DUF5996 family protein [Longimicrobiales bacterium]